MSFGRKPVGEQRRRADPLVQALGHHAQRLLARPGCEQPAVRGNDMRARRIE